jgi:hypothetical protein
VLRGLFWPRAKAELNTMAETMIAPSASITGSLKNRSLFSPDVFINLFLMNEY